MQKKKYELVTTDTKIINGKTLYRIRAIRNFGDVKAGDLGGYIEKENSLSHDGNAWVNNNACVYGNARVCDNACVCDNAQICGGAWVFDNARVFDNAQVYGDARVCDNAHVYDNARVYGNANVCDNARIYGNANVCDNAWVYGNTHVLGNVLVSGGARIYGDTIIIKAEDYATITGFGSKNRTTTFFRLKNGDIGVKCGCFHGTINEFREKVKETHGNTKFAREYLILADAMELHFQ